MSYNFTDSVRKVLVYAREEAVRLRHAYVGPEHILLGLLRDGEGVGAALLAELNVSLAGLRAQVEAANAPGQPGGVIGPDLPYTSHGKKVLEFAMAEAHELGYDFVGSEHLLLGLLRCQASPTAGLLAAAGLTLERARAAALRLRGPDRGPRTSAGAVPRYSVERISRLALLVGCIALAVALVALGLALRAQP